MEVAHLAASIHDLTRVNTKADSTLTAIRTQHEEDSMKARAQIENLKSELEATKSKNLDAACQDLREEATRAKNELFSLTQVSDRNALAAANDIRGLKASLEVSKKLQAPAKDCTVVAPHEGAAAIEIQRLSQSLLAAQESSLAFKEQGWFS
jgi:hypothetical protein